MKLRRRWIAVGLVVLWALFGMATSGAEESVPYGTLTEFSTGISAEAEPAEITNGPDGNLWFTELAAGQPVGRITPTGEVTDFSTGITPGSFPDAITAGPD